MDFAGRVPIRFVIITGLSGAGKSETVKCFEDLGYFCVDNLPPALIGKFAELCAHSDDKINRVALVVDIRGGDFFTDAAGALGSLEEMGFAHEILFLEANEEALIRRFKESRRRHPLSASGSIIEGIRAERERLEDLRGRADRIIDTTGLSAQELRRQITEEYGTNTPEASMLVSVVSFGFKHGLPLDADLVFDVRFLPNPHYVEALRPLTGEEPAVAEYVMKWPLAARYLRLLFELLEFLLPQYRKEGRSALSVAIGCTGGRHRSVVFANRLAEHISELGYRVRISHRDAGSKKEAVTGG